MWISLDLHYRVKRSLESVTALTTRPELEAKLRAVVVDWIDQRLRANLSRRGFRLRLLADLHTANPNWRDVFDASPVPSDLHTPVILVVETAVKEWIERSARFKFEAV